MKRVIYAYFLLWEYTHYRDIINKPFRKYWRGAWRYYHTRKDWFERAQEIHRYEKRQLSEHR